MKRALKFGESKILSLEVEKMEYRYELKKGGNGHYYQDLGDAVFDAKLLAQRTMEEVVIELFQAGGERVVIATVVPEKVSENETRSSVFAPEKIEVK